MSKCDKENWIGFDLDGTLAEYHSGDYHKYGATYIGPPIKSIVNLAAGYVKQGRIVKVFTARCAGEYNEEVERAIQDWTEKHIGARLEVTNIKTMDMECLYDDRSRQVIPNKGIILENLFSVTLKQILGFFG